MKCNAAMRKAVSRRTNVHVIRAEVEKTNETFAAYYSQICVQENFGLEKDIAVPDLHARCAKERMNVRRGNQLNDI